MSADISTRRQAERRPLGRVLLVPLTVTVLVTGGTAVWLTFEVPADDRMSVASFGGAAAILLMLAVTVAAYGLRSADRLREELLAKEAEATALADELLPAVVRGLRDGDSSDTALSLVQPPADPAHRRVLTTLAKEIGHGERMRASAMSACANAAGRVQALATSMLAELREMEDRHGEEVLGDLLKLDHSTAQAGRLADSIAVLTGARSGRRWTKPIPMESVLRGSVGRINSYQRVRLHSTSTVAVAGFAAEGVMHALAELMDNATSFSPPTEEVHVYVEEVSVGVVVTIEDAGLVMSPAALRRAEQAVSAEPLDLTMLSGTRLGLAVVGRLARKHQLTVSFRPSARGGTGVVVVIPQQLITEVRKESAPAAGQPVSVPTRANGSANGTVHAVNGAAASAGDDAVQPAPARRTGPAGQTGAPATDAAPRTAETDGPTEDRLAGDSTSGLPKRRRGETLATAKRSAGSHPRPAEPERCRPRPNAGARFGAFRQASRGNTGAGQPDGATCDENGERGEYGERGDSQRTPDETLTHQTLTHQTPADEPTADPALTTDPAASADQSTTATDSAPDTSPGAVALPDAPNQHDAP